MDEVLIIGAGFAGLCMAIQLRKAGIESFTILERADDIGGTWRDNHYPGCACDVQSHLYSYSFEPHAAWSRTFAEQPEILGYLRRCARKYGLLRQIAFGQNVTNARFDERQHLWCVETAGGNVYRARVVVAGMGALSNAAYPNIDGLSGFAGAKFHSAHWDHSLELAGKRVAVIGSGASAIQFVPQIAPHVARLDLYQRTPPWILPKPDRPIRGAERAMYAALPLVLKLMRWAFYWRLETRMLAFTEPVLMRPVAAYARRYLRRCVQDPALRAKLLPEYTLGCKRVLISNDYYPALTSPNVDVITEGIREIRERSILDRANCEREVDVIIFATGFKVQELVPRGMFFGSGGRELADAWRDGAEAYKGTTVAGFPNLFFLLGPNTGLGHSSVIFMIESQVAYVMDALRQMRTNNWSALEVQAEAQAAFNRELDAKSASAVWKSGCRSWYLTENGRNTTMWPDFTFRFRHLTRRFDSQAYRTERQISAPPGAIGEAGSTLAERK
ncbi:MAG: NAD(P)/FAD-dependent oxidoreductase [Deltaproteobacteria bacterium]